MKLFRSLLTGLLLFNSSAPGAHAYPNFTDNHMISESMTWLMPPYLLPLDHHLKPTLDALFGGSRVTANLETLTNAGFVTLYNQSLSSYVIVARHPAVEDYLFKIYLDSELRKKVDKDNWIWLTRRCIGAERIRKIIQKKQFKHFVVPDKWLYPLPYFPGAKQPVILVVQDMHLVSEPDTRKAWKTEITKEHLDELYYILKKGCGSLYLTGNIPYTKEGKFAFIDTEYPKRKIKVKKLRKHFSEEMQLYWDELTANDTE